MIKKKTKNEIKKCHHMSLGPQLGGECKWVQNIHDKHADQPIKLYATPYRIQVLPLQDCHSWKQHIFKKVHICQMYYTMLHSTLCNASVDLVVVSKALYKLMHSKYTHIYTQYMYNRSFYICIIHLLHPLCAWSGYGPVCHCNIFFVYTQ